MLLALNVLQTFLSGVPCSASTAVPLFVGTQCVLIFYIALLMCYQPMLHDESWKLPTKVGTIAVCSVAATLNFVATLQYSECDGAAVDAADAETAAAIISTLFIGSAVVVVLLMFSAFTMMLIMGGDDLLSRSIRVFVVLSCWLTRCSISSCATCCCPSLLPPSDDDEEAVDAEVAGRGGGGDFADGTGVSCAAGEAAGVRGRERASTTGEALVVDEIVPVFAPDGSIDLSSIDEISGASSSRPVSASSIASSSSASISLRRSVSPRRSVRWSDETVGSSVSRHSMDIPAAGADGQVRSSTPPSDLHRHARGRPPPTRGGGGGGGNRRRRPVSVRLNLGFANLAAELEEAAAHKERKTKKLAPKKHNKKHLRRVSTQRAFEELETALSAKKGSWRDSKRASGDCGAVTAGAGGYATPPASMAAEWAAALQGTALRGVSGGGGGGGKQPATSGEWIPGSPPLPKPALFGDGPLDALTPLDLSATEYSEGTPVGGVAPSSPWGSARSRSPRVQQERCGESPSRRHKSLKKIVKEQSAKLSKSLSFRDILSAPTPRMVQVQQPTSAFDAFTAEMANLDTSGETPRTPTPRTPGGRLESRNPSFVKDGVGTPRDTHLTSTRGIGRAMEL